MLLNIYDLRSFFLFFLGEIVLLLLFPVVSSGGSLFHQPSGFYLSSSLETQFLIHYSTSWCRPRQSTRVETKRVIRTRGPRFVDRCHRRRRRTSPLSLEPDLFTRYKTYPTTFQCPRLSEVWVRREPICPMEVGTYNIILSDLCVFSSCFGY